MDEEITSMKNKLIIYKTNEKLSKDMIILIQNLLLNGKKREEFSFLLKKIEDILE